MPFRIGRKFAQHTYPQARATSTVPLARNSASGPATAQVIPASAFVTWSVIESGTVAGVNVPITPKSTGIVHVTGVITVSSVDGATVELSVRNPDAIYPVPAAEVVTIPSADSVAIPFDVILGAGANGPALAIGVPISIRVQLDAGPEITVAATSSTISIREVTPVTG